jgi:putative membrane protein
MALKHLLAGAALIGLMAQPALAQSQDTTRQQPAAQATQQQLAQEDMEFATEAAKGGLMEVKLGELAQQQAASDDVKQFGQRMVEDHGKANDQLKQIAQDKAIDLPQELPADAQQKYDELKQESGDEFDQAYMDEMVSDHQKDVEEFQQYVETGQDPDLTSFAEQTLPTLEEHLQLAQQTQEQVKAAASEPPATGAQGGQQQAGAAQEQRPQGKQQQAATAPEQQPATAAGQAATQAEQPVSLEEVLGAEVVNAAGDEVGEIEDVVLDQNGAYYAILSVGGFLGLGEKKVAVPLDQLELAEDQVYLMATASEEQLEQMPEYDEQQYRPYAEQQGLLQD